MLWNIWNFVKRHKKKFLFSSFLVGGSWLAYKYLVNKLKEIKEENEQEYINMIRRQHHFESNQRTCNMTVLSMIPNIREILVKRLNTEDITAQLKQGPSNKLELWGKLKISSISRTISSVYGCCLMSLMLKVQLNVMGAYLFIDSSTDSHNGYVPRKHRTTKAVQERYLSLIKHFVGPGFEDLLELISSATTKELDSLSLRDELTLENVESVINSIRERVEDIKGDNSSYPLISYLLPDEQKPDIEISTPEEELYDKLVAETRGVFNNSDFHSVIKLCLDRGFSKLLDYVAEHFKNISTSETDIHDCTVPLAKLVPVINALVYRIVCDAPNVFIQEILVLEEVKKLASNIYEVFSHQDNSWEP